MGNEDNFVATFTPEIREKIRKSLTNIVCVAAYNLEVRGNYWMPNYGERYSTLL